MKHTKIILCVKTIELKTSTVLCQRPLHDLTSTAGHFESVQNIHFETSNAQTSSGYESKFL